MFFVQPNLAVFQFEELYYPSAVYSMLALLGRTKRATGHSNRFQPFLSNYDVMLLRNVV